MKQAVLLAAVVAAALLVALAVAGAALVGTGETTISVGEVRDGRPLDPPADGAHGIVLSTHQSSPGIGIFGLQLQQPRYKASIAIVPPPGCEPGDDGRLLREGPCAEAAVEGGITGDGTTMDGVEFVIVSVRVSNDCHEALEYGDAWPSADPACA